MQRKVFEQTLRTPFNTLYMALRQMEEKGLVRRLRVDGEIRAHYVLAEREQFSQSLVCGQCGAQQWIDDAEVRQAVERLCRKRGLQLAQYHVNVQARCELTPTEFPALAGSRHSVQFVAVLNFQLNR